MAVAGLLTAAVTAGVAVAAAVAGSMTMAVLAVTVAGRGSMGEIAARPMVVAAGARRLRELWRA